MQQHDTLSKFLYPASLIREYSHWAVLLRPKQATLGSLVVVSIADIRRFSGIPMDGFMELNEVIGDCEGTLSDLFSYDKINYLMLMMVDLQVHMHVIPRYSSERHFAGGHHRDAGWPGPPSLGVSLELSSESEQRLLVQLQEAWPARQGPPNAPQN